MRLERFPRRELARLAAVLALACALAQRANADRLPLVGSGATAPVRAGGISPASHVIVSIHPDSVPCTELVTFSGLPAGENPGTNYDGIVQSGGMSFAERFVGQTLSYSGDFDVISGVPTNPLSLQVGAPGQNLDVFFYTSNVLAGLGNFGFPDLDAIGEGSIAMSFPVLQSRVGFELVGGNGGSATLGFYRADGSLIDNVVVSGLADIRYAFATPDGLRSIAGILIQSSDPSGVGVDNICYEGGIVNSRATSWSGLKRRYR